MKNFRELTKEFNIEIPIIQRDYVQGREEKKAKEIRKSFLTDIFNALENNQKFHLDFVYGSFEDKKFIPIDGQQRLTTLFLLYWYFSKKENKDFQVNFKYKTRVSSREFCEKLFSFEIDFNKESNICNQKENRNEPIKNQILDNKEFIPFWENDPTIKSMLTMIEEIHCMGKNFNFFDRLDKITFEVFRLEDFGKEQTEELYRKMNSRGKALSPFENFKAIIEKILYQNENKEKYKEVAKKFEKDWVDIFWKDYKDKDKNYLIDDSFMNFVYFITEMLAFDNKASTEIREKITSFSFLKEFYQNEDNLDFLEKALDNFSEIEEVSNDLEKNFIFFEKNNKVNLLTEIITNYSNSTINNKILLFMMVKSNYKKINDIYSLMRMVRNILYRERQLKRAGAIDYTLTLDYKALPNFLDSFDKFMNDPYNDILTISYNDKNFTHEKEKAEFLKNNPDLEKKLFDLEDYKYIKGDLRLFFDKNFTFKDIRERIIFLNDNLQEIFNKESDLIIRALLSIGNYSLWIGNIYRDDKHFFGQVNKWEIFLTYNPKSNDNIKIYSNFFEKYEKESNLNQIIRNKLDEYKNKNKDWIYYFLMYPEITKTHKLFNVFGWFNKKAQIEKLERETRITNNHINIYLLALKNEIHGKIDKKIDEKSNLSYLIIKDNKVEVKNNSILYKGKNYPLFEKDDAIEILKNIL